ncbi:hypothetical protein SAMN05216225_102533 [Ornithinibacillus halophilus]|uniref:Uncharacterized protein n=1 Tax=Ornithinibacillus halophilus TaxID=930117 RepID=A0A1M5IRG6_9BACI|nr:hypothetical protein SAMN05216225_102533 [Ornithinibacillus halophilus]
MTIKAEEIYADSLEIKYNFLRAKIMLPMPSLGLRLLAPPKTFVLWEVGAR